MDRSKFIKMGFNVIKIVIYLFIFLRFRTKVFSNRSQLEKLVSLMETNPNIARNIIKKSEAKAQWENFTTQLNSLGPPIRDAETWMRVRTTLSLTLTLTLSLQNLIYIHIFQVWTDLKAKTKKKKMENEKEYKATGGGPNRIHVLTPLEETIARVINLERVINPPGRDFGIQSIEDVVSAAEDISSESTELHNKENVAPATLESDANIEGTSGTPIGNRGGPGGSPGPGKRSAGSPGPGKRPRMMEEYFDRQEKNMTEIKAYLKELSETAKEALAVEKEKLRILQQDIDNRTKTVKYM